LAENITNDPHSVSSMLRCDNEIMSHLVAGIVWRWPRFAAGLVLQSSGSSQNWCTTETSQTFVRPQHS